MKAKQAKATMHGVSVTLRYDSSSKGWQFVQHFHDEDGELVHIISCPWDGGSVWNCVQTLLEKNKAIKKTISIVYQTRTRKRRHP